jgi:hypothetical protein
MAETEAPPPLPKSQCLFGQRHNIMLKSPDALGKIKSRL